MDERLSEVLPLVTKPIRYTGGEYNSFCSEPEPGKVTWVLTMPDVYEIGMSNYGLKVLYSIINKLPNGLCERCYVPWPDFGGILRSRGLPLYALESGRPVREFDIVGVSLQSELSYTNLLYLLDLAGISLHREERGLDDPVVVAGGPGAVNPLPLAEFVDVFVVGDGEEAVRDITAVYADWDRRSRAGLLRALASLPGVFVPGVSDRRRERVVRRVVPELREEDFPFPPLVPICEVIHDRLTVEIARGCVRGCRFCQAGMINRPLRFRGVEEVVRIAERGIRASGWEEVSLLALSALDYPYLLELVRRLNERLRERRVAISLPSTRGEDFSAELALSLQEVKKAGLTFAPETASPRLRALVNKNISEVKIMESVRNALDAGWAGVKLYFMIGLPGETAADVREIGRFVEEVARLCRGRMVRFNLTPFIPKPHTPLQWAGFADLRETQEKMALLKGMLTRRNIRAKWENPECSLVQALIARGDERLGGVIERVYRAGGIFQEWSDFFQFSLWQDALAASGVDPAEYLRERSVAEVLPWDFIEVGVDKRFLVAEYERALAGKETPDCLSGGCSGCGACVGPKPMPPAAPGAEAEERRAVRWRARFEGGGGFAELKRRFRVKYTVEEQFRFAAHLDRVRAFYRALRRSELPIVYTRGFAPKPMVSFGPPLPVGVVSSGEYVDFYIAFSYSGNIVRDLGPFLPKGLRIVGARQVPNSAPSLGGIINFARYEVILDGEEIPIATSGVPGVVEVSRRANGVVQVDLTIAPGIKLFDTLARVFDLSPAAARCLQVKRVDCFVREPDGRVRSAFGDELQEEK